MQRVIINTDLKEIPESCYDCPICYDNMACPIAGQFHVRDDNSGEWFWRIGVCKDGFYRRRLADCPMEILDGERMDKE